MPTNRLDSLFFYRTFIQLSTLGCRTGVIQLIYDSRSDGVLAYLVGLRGSLETPFLEQGQHGVREGLDGLNA